MVLWMLLTQPAIEGLAQYIYMNKYINDISERKNNISEGRSNNNTIKVQYNIFQSYISLTLPLNKEGILQHHQQQHTIRKMTSTRGYRGISLKRMENIRL